MEIDKFIVHTEAEIAKLMNLRRQHREDIKLITKEIDLFEAAIRLRKVEINEAIRKERGLCTVK
jgi:hypothetical protein